jgi:class 3 adenylate cyclase/tetratricopeptide (TPR) repeat protein
MNEPMDASAAGSQGGRSLTVDQLLDRAVAAMNRGEYDAARELAGAVLATDTSNRDAAALLAESAPGGELRRASLLFVDLAGSTELSERHEPELYRGVLRRYTALCREVIEAGYGGHVSHVAGDGLFAVFGLPTPHENDAERAVRAALDIAQRLGDLSGEVERAVGERLQARAAVHKGLVYLDIEEDEVYGLAANVASRLHALAAPDTVVISEEVHDIVGDIFETRAEPAQQVKGVTQPLRPFRVLAERPLAPAERRRFVGPLVDRSDEWAALRGVWADVRRGAGAAVRAVHLVGEPGIGKSRLWSSFLDDVGPEVRTRLELVGSPFHTGANFRPIRAFIEARIRGRHGDHSGPAGPDDGGADRLERLEHEVALVGLDPGDLVPLLGPIADIAFDVGSYTAPATEGHKLRAAITDAAARFLLACLDAGPAVLVVEDVHWCDDSTLDVVGRVAGADRPDLLVLTTSRTGPPASLRSAQVIELAPLDTDSSIELVRALDPTVARESGTDLVTRADGVPLFLEELVHGAGQPRLAAAGTLPSGDVPDALYEPLVSRLYAAPAAVPVAAAAATIGRDVDHGLLGRVVDLPELEFQRAVTDLLGGLILERVDGDGCYRFRHELLREVAYDLQPPSRRRYMHGRVADALVGQDRDDVVDWPLVAGHYDRAARPAEAVAAYQRAADRAQRLGALAEARSLLGRAIDLVAALPESHERWRREVGLRLRRGFLAVSAEGNSSVDAVRDYERCLEIALADPTSDEMFSTLISLWGYYVIRGDLGRAERVSQMLRSALPGERALYEPDNAAAFGVIRWYSGQFADARERLESAVAAHAARGTGGHYAAIWFMPTDAWASAHIFLALSRYVRGDRAGADEQMQAALVRCRELDFPQGPYTAASVHAYAMWIHAEAGDLEAARAAADEVSALADRHGFDFWVFVGTTQRAAVDGLDDLQASRDADTLAARAQVLDGLIATWQMLDVAVFVSFYMSVSARLRAGAGDAGGACARLDEALGVARATGMHFYDAELLRLRAEFDSGQDDASADEQLRDALDLASAQGATVFHRRIAHDLRRRGLG